MNHPPIPPNCSWFFVKTISDNVWGFEIGDNDWWPLTTEDWAKISVKDRVYFRRVISAVARCAWLDEAIRLSRSAEIQECFTECERARVFATEWRTWGIEQESEA